MKKIYISDEDAVRYMEQLHSKLKNTISLFNNVSDEDEKYVREKYKELKATIKDDDRRFNNSKTTSGENHLNAFLIPITLEILGPLRPGHNKDIRELKQAVEDALSRFEYYYCQIKK